MAIVQSIPQIWSRELLRNIHNTSGLLSLSRDVSDLLAQGGNKVILNSVLDNATVKDYTIHTNMEYEDVTDAKVELNVNKDKYIQLRFDDLELVQSVAPVVMRKNEDSIRNMVRQINKDLYVELSKAGIDQASGSLSSAGSYALASNGWDAAERKKYIEAMLDVHVALKKKGWHEYAAPPTFVTGYDMESLFIRYLVVDKDQFADGDMQNKAFRDAAFVKAFGFPIMGVQDVPYQTSAGTNVNPGFFVLPQDTLYHVIQMRANKMESIPAQFGRALAMRYAYGMLRPRVSHVHKLSMTVT